MIEIFDLDANGRVEDICKLYLKTSQKNDFCLEEVFEYCKNNKIDIRIFNKYRDVLYEYYIEERPDSNDIEIEKQIGEDYFYFRHKSNMGNVIYSLTLHCNTEKQLEIREVMEDIILSDLGSLSYSIKEALEKELNIVEVLTTINAIEIALALIHYSIKFLNQIKGVNVFIEWYKNNKEELNRLLEENGG